jgi:putative ABC transport system substrate-binding protein
MAVEYRGAENQIVFGYWRSQPMSSAAIVAVIVASGNQAAQAAKAATTTIPIVFTTGGDPIALGLVASLNRPGANVTGITALAAELASKQLQLLRALIPNAGLLGALADPAFPGTQFIITDLQAAERTLGLQLIILNARTDRDLETAFATLSQQRVGGVLVGNSAFYSNRAVQLAALAARHARLRCFQSVSTLWPAV